MVNQAMELPFHRVQAVTDFEQMMDAGKWYFIKTKVLRQDNHLIPLSALQPFIPAQRLYRGIQQVPLRQIVGSVNRKQDFSRRFHPLQKTLRSRWVNLRLLADSTGWPPIQVYRVGDLYFVEDGHHRVSVANYLHYRTIEAEVWEYPVKLAAAATFSVQQVLAQLQQHTAFARKPLKTNCVPIG